VVLAPPAPRRPLLGSLLGRRLNALAAGFDASRIHPDPLEIVRGHRGRDDLEVAGLVAAGLAFGGVETILVSVRRALAPLGPRPAAGLAASGDRGIRRALRGFRHRWVDGDDVAALLGAARRLREEHGSLEDAFLAGDPGGATVEGALSAFAAALRRADPGFARRGAAAFVPSPADGSACKRPLLFLRWMVRRDGVDTGAWRGVDPSRLVLPLDTHVARIARALGLLRRKADDWRAALEATASLRLLDPADPIRYDFAICRMGILDLCPRERDPVNCRACQLYDVCAYGSGREQERERERVGKGRERERERERVRKGRERARERRESGGIGLSSPRPHPFP
jgi:uncharacterized protein (TIGR02757 family)